MQWNSLACCKSTNVQLEPKLQRPREVAQSENNTSLRYGSPIS